MQRNYTDQNVSELNNQLLEAVKSKEFVEIDSLIKAGAQPANIKNGETGKNLLHLVAEWENVSSVHRIPIWNLLVQHGVRMGEIDQRDRTPIRSLYWSSKGRGLYCIKEIIMEYNNNNEDICGYDLLLAEMVLAMHKDTVRLLLERGADPNKQTSGSAEERPKFLGWSCLHFAVHLGNVDLIETLLRFGADPSIKNTAGQTPIELADSLGHHQCQELFKNFDGITGQSIYMMLVDPKTDVSSIDYGKYAPYKDVVLAYILRLPKEDRLVALQEAHKKDSPLGLLFWERRGFLETDIETGTLKRIKSQYDKDYLASSIDSVLSKVKEIELPDLRGAFHVVNPNAASSAVITTYQVATDLVPVYPGDSPQQTFRAQSQQPLHSVVPNPLYAPQPAQPLPSYPNLPAQQYPAQAPHTFTNLMNQAPNVSGLSADYWLDQAPAVPQHQPSYLRANSVFAVPSSQPVANQTSQDRQGNSPLFG